MNRQESPLGLPRPNLEWVTLDAKLRKPYKSKLTFSTFASVPQEGVVVYEDPDVYDLRVKTLLECISEESSKILTPRLFVMEQDATISKMSPVSLLINPERVDDEQVNVILFCANAGSSRQFYDNVRDQYIKASNNAFKKAGLEPFPQYTNVKRRILKIRDE